MREIKFRGRKKEEGSPKGDVGEWVYGYLVREGGFAYIYDEGGNKHYVEWGSVGQYTGLKDKKGKGIYTGDIVQHENSNPVEVFIGHLGELQPFAFHNTARGWEVIGNIYEHPHLLQPSNN